MNRTVLGVVSAVALSMWGAGCGGGSGGNGATADGGGGDSTAPTDAGGGGSDSSSMGSDSTVASDSAMPSDDSGMMPMTDTGMPGLGDTGATAMGDTGMSGMGDTGTTGMSDTGTTGMSDTGTTTVPDSGTITSSCAPADVFLKPWFAVSGGGATRDIVSGDLNNDGKTDLVALGSGATSAFVVNLNTGNGTFAAAAAYQGAEVSGEGIGLGDVNGDGYLDVLYSAFMTGSSSESAVAVALNDGTGRFGAPVTYDAMGIPEVIRTVDVNKDGKVDAVISLQNGVGGEDLVIMLNAGGGMLSPPTTVNGVVASLGHVMDFADLDGDGNIDIVTYNDPMGPCYLLGMGNGQFKSQVCLTGPNVLENEAVATGDVNGDGKPDIVLWNYSDPTNAADVFLNMGGTFGTFKPMSLSTGSVYDGQLADINNDGKLDVLTFDAPNGQVYLSLGNGDGTFQTTALAFALSEGGVDQGPLQVGDFLGDGLKGFAMSTFENAGWQVVPSTCRTTIPTAASVLPAGVGPSTCATAKVTLGPVSTVTGASSLGTSHAADLDGDGKADLVIAGGANSNTAFTYQLSNGDGTFKAPVAVMGETFGTVVQVADVNGDGKADVLYGAINSESDTGIAVALNMGGAMFAGPKFTAFDSASQEYSTLEVADFNNDGKLDVILDGQLGLGMGDGTFAGLGVPTSLFHVDIARPYRFVDLNGDKQLDIVSASPAGNNNTGGFCVSLNIGSGNFAAPSCPLATMDVSPNGVAVGDVNGDGKADVVVISENMAGGLQVALGVGDGTFHTPLTTALPDLTPDQVELADFNNDGKLDLLVWYDDNQFILQTGNGDGTFASMGQAFGAGSGEQLGLTIAVGDFAGVGLPGFAVVNTSRPGFDVVKAICSP